jgi:hypothetical protein
MVIRIFH